MYSVSSLILGYFSNVAFTTSHVQPYRPALALRLVGRPCGLYDQCSVDRASTKHLDMPEAPALQNAQSGQAQCCGVLSTEHRGMTLGTAHRTACSGWACLAPRANPIPQHCLPQCLAEHELGLGLILHFGWEHATSVTIVRLGLPLLLELLELQLLLALTRQLCRYASLGCLPEELATQDSPRLMELGLLLELE